MKFKQLRMINFMRYRGEQTIEFSCDNQKNVTVVLGENTVGKTTIAQAFRWGLYGEIIQSKYDDKDGVNLINNDVLAEMGPNDSKKVEVEIIMQQFDHEYTLKRVSEYVRNYPTFTARERMHKLSVAVKDMKNGSTEILDKLNDVNEIISEILPKDLSRYFFFDGERWNDTKTKQNDIKQSVYNMMGLSAIKEMMYHLKDKGNSSVVTKFRRRIVGKSDDYDKKLEFIEKRQDMIKQKEERIIELENERELYEKKVQESEEILDSNRKIEEEQQKVRSLENAIESGKRNLENYYAQIINNFSNSYKYFATPLLQDVLEILEEAKKVQGKDIPKLHGDTIDFLLKEHKCICGCSLEEGSEHRATLERLKKVIPPMTIGTVASNYEKNFLEWKAEGEELRKTIEELAEKHQGEKDDIEENEDEIQRLEKKIDRKINFEQERRKLNSNKAKVKQLLNDTYISKKLIEDYKADIEKAENELNALQKNDEKNKIIQECILYAEDLYQEARKIFLEGETTLIQELNKLIQKNFKEMFKEQEKTARLTKDYEIKLFYNNFSQDTIGELEASGLSEGEKIARNFVFIVSILEFAHNQKESEKFESQTMPLVLDGPFSKLSSDNIALISKVLPTSAEQVIVFMLDKDWEHTGLQEYTGAKYRVKKEIDENSTSIEKVE